MLRLLIGFGICAATLSSQVGLGQVMPLKVDSSLGQSSADQIIEVFGRQGCQFCSSAREFVDSLESELPGLTVRYHDVEKDEQALLRLRDLTRAAGLSNAALPAFFLRGRLLIGFSGAETTGATLRKALIFGWQDFQGQGEPAPANVCATEASEPCPSAASAPEDSSVAVAELPWLGELRLADVGLPLFTLALGLVDGFNPCAMWVLIFLLSLLVNVRDRRRMALIAGVFVFVSGAVYFALMAAWLNFFFLVGSTRTLQMVLGVVACGIGAVHIKDFFAFKKGLTLSIPDAAKPRIYQHVGRVIRAENLWVAMVAVAGLAVLVNMVELLCTAGLPMVYTQALAAQQLAGWQYYGYLLFYNLAYMFDDALMVAIAVMTLSRHRLQEKGGRILKLISGTVILSIGMIMLFKPQWLELL